MNGSRILVVGCGELGSRHLQSLASLESIRLVEVVDPNPEALALGQKRVYEVPLRNDSVTYRWLSSVDEAQANGDLCIVATQAKGRCRLVRELYQKLGYSSFLLEKIVGQSIDEINDLLRFTQRHSIRVWVNFQTRAYPFHKRVKEIIDINDPIVFTVSGGNHGLATNGVHNADLFAYYSEAPFIYPAGCSVDSVLHRSKRGETLFDLSGSILGHTKSGSRFSLNYASDHINSEQISISTRNYRCIVDHMQRWAVESDARSGWIWRSVPFEGQIMVSDMTKSFASTIISDQVCELPTLEESMISHRFILSELLPHFNELLGRDSQKCPVT